MIVVLKHNVYPIKNGFAAHSPELRLTAHGYSPEVAQLNLKRTVICFLKPFEREGKLIDEITLLGLKTEADGADVSVTFVNS